MADALVLINVLDMATLSCSSFISVLAEVAIVLVIILRAPQASRQQNITSRLILGILH